MWGFVEPYGSDKQNKLPGVLTWQHSKSFNTTSAPVLQWSSNLRVHWNTVYLKYIKMESEKEDYGERRLWCEVATVFIKYLGQITVNLLSLYYLNVSQYDWNILNQRTTTITGIGVKLCLFLVTNKAERSRKIKNIP